MGSSQTTTQANDPWAPAQPYIQQGLTDAGALYGAGGFQVQPYQRDMVADRNGVQGRGDQMTMDAARAGVNDIGRAQGSVQDVMQRNTGGSQYAQPFNQAINQTMNRDGPNYAQNTFQDLAGQGLNRNTQQAINRGLNGTTSVAFNRGINTAQDTGFDRQFNQATQQAGGIDPRFNNVINRNTDPNTANQLSADMQRNVMEGIMPGINASFAGSGMTGSSLHAQNLAKGLASGMAPAQMALGEAQRNREMQAAGMAQDAYGSGQDRAMTAGGMRQSALDAGRNRSLQAGQVSQANANAQADRGLAAGNLALQGQNTTANTQLNAANAGMDAFQAQQAARLQAGQMAQGAMDTNEAQRMQAAGMQPALNAAQIASAQAYTGVGDAQQQQRQNEINANMLRYQQNQTGPMNAIQDYLTMTSGLGGQYSTQTGTSQYNPGLLGILGAGLQFSDARLKEDVKRVGTTDSGLGVYTYKYRGGKTYHMGVMAQEAQQITPEAVQASSDGWLAVDYGRIA